MIILGGGDTLWNDIAALPFDINSRTIIAVNDAIKHYKGRIDYAVSLHPEKLKGWVNKPCTVISHKRVHGAPINRVVPELWGGSSGLYAVQIALKELGAEEVILCGVPITPTPHFWGETWSDAEKYRKAWIKNKNELAKVRSMSGWTAELLGKPEFLGSA